MKPAYMSSSSNLQLTGNTCQIVQNGLIDHESCSYLYVNRCWRKVQTNNLTVRVFASHFDCPYATTTPWMNGK